MATVWANLLLILATSTMPITGIAGCDQISEAKTEKYIETLDLEKFQHLGTDYASQRYDPERIGKPREEIDQVYDYDFERLAAVQEQLKGVDRRRVLEHIFSQLTKDADSNTEKHLAVLRFMQRISVHNGIVRPIMPDKTRVKDPLVLLELNEMRCGQVNRLTADLFVAGGYQGRGVSLGGHNVAEVFYDDDWHYIDADNCGGNGICVIDADGTIPSWQELSDAPHRIDALPFKYELKLDGAPRTNSPAARSDRCFFFHDTTRTQTYRYKTGSLDDPQYGWNDTEAEPVGWTLLKRAPTAQPGAVKFEEVDLFDDETGSKARITWEPSQDEDNDLLGYRVYVSSTPRGWSYSKFAGSAQAERYWHDTGGWKPEMYEALYQLPPHDVALIETSSDPTVQIELPDGPVFVTIMPFDEYHERAGKTLYFMSNELRIDTERAEE
jgi:hypothetical protein